jgi:hypothetical protein
MRRFFRPAILTITLASALASALSPSTQSPQMAELSALQDKVKSADTRTRVSAFHQVWTIALASNDSEVKLFALNLMKEPAGSASDHIRMPAVYAIAETANSTADPAVKSRALECLKEPIVAGQLPIRLVAIDAINSIARAGTAANVALQAIELLGESVRSGNNGVRIPAINAVAHIALASNDDSVINAALDLMQPPLQSATLIGGMEVRLMAVVEVERLGVAAHDVALKTKASQMLQAYASNNQWEPEAQSRAANGAARIQSTINKTPETGAAIGKLTVTSAPEGADIELDGNFVGNTPSELSIAPGNHTVLITKAGFLPWQRKLETTAGSTVHITAELEKSQLTAPTKD